MLIILCRLDSLTAPRVEVINVTYTTMSLRWTAINIAVEKWKVDLLDEDDVAIEVWRCSP